MFVHHVVTLCLLGFSWASNLVRIGTLVLIIHDFADIPLEVFVDIIVKLLLFDL
jgi:ceramide synthetase